MPSRRRWGISVDSRRQYAQGGRAGAGASVTSRLDQVDIIGKSNIRVKIESNGHLRVEQRHSSCGPVKDREVANRNSFSSRI